MAQVDERFRNPISNAELDRRWARVREIMRASKVDALVIQGSNNFAGLGGYFRWFTGIPPLGTYPQSVIFPASGPMTIVHHGDFGGEADLDPVNGPHYGIARRLTTPMFPAVHYCADYDADLIAREVLKSGFKTIALPGASMMYHGFASRLQQQLGAIHHADITDALDDLKAVKSEEDIGWIRKAALMQDEIFGKVLAHVKPGMHDYEVMAYSNYIGEMLDGETGYFLGSSSPPGKPALFRMKSHHGRRMESGDVLVWQAENSGPGGYFAHMCRYIVLGRAPQELTDMIGQTIDMQKFTLDLLKPGARCSDIFAEYNAAMKKRGFQGEKRLHCHGQGYENVERPLIRSDETMRIAANMNIGIHPIVANERVAATISDNFLIRTDGPHERLHQTPQKVFEL